MKKKRRKNKNIAVLAAALAVSLCVGACEQVNNVIEVADTIRRDLPSANDTLTSLIDISATMEQAMSRGETELTLNVAGVTEDELRAIGDNMSTFWGKPTHYTVTNEYKDVDGIVPDRPIDVKTITNTFELSYNFFVYDFIKNGSPVPDDVPRAKDIAAVLPDVASEVFTEPQASDYAKTLAAHDWLVANLEYDVTTGSISDENGTYGAFVLRRTMCQGYAEALELLLKCYTDVEIIQIVGEALNTGLFRNDENLESVPEDWRGHAWNAVKMNGEWYQIDTTFNDPLGNPTGRVTHFYFGQSDGVMLKNHRWEYDYFPASYAGDFLFYRESGLFAEDWDSFEAIVEGIIAEDPPEYFEAAVTDSTITEDNIQFVYSSVDNLDAIMWSEQVWNNIHVHSIELIFQS